MTTARTDEKDIQALAQGGRTNVFGFMLRLAARIPFLFIAGRLYGPEALGRLQGAGRVLPVWRGKPLFAGEAGGLVWVRRGEDDAPLPELPGLQQPLLHWTPSVAPSSLTQYRGSLFPQWQGDLFAATLAERSVRRIRLLDGKLAGEDILFEELGERIRDVRSGPDGALYLLTDNANGRVLKVVPAE